jgi:hypothetical protein
MADEKDPLERAKELLVYLPVGFAIYLRDHGPSFARDHGPSFINLFVARGRSEVEKGRRNVSDQMSQARAAGEATVENNGAPVLQLVADGLSALRDRVEEALNALGVVGNESPAEPASTDAAASASAGPAAAPATVATNWAAPSAAPVGVPAVNELAIPGYDDLSASQIVDLLEPLGRDDIEAIGTYETAHRARNTVLGKIEQLTRGT